MQKAGCLHHLVGTNKISRADMEQALKLQGSVGDKAMRIVAMEYLEEGMILSSQKAIANFLKARFMILPPIVEEKIKQVTNTAVLDEAVRQAALVENIEQFSSWLEETSS